MDRNQAVPAEAEAGKVKRRRRTKGPSEKIRSLAAMSLAPKIGYLKLSNLLGEDPRLEQFFKERLPSRIYERGESIFPTGRDEQILFVVRTGQVNIYRPSAIGRHFSVKRLGADTVFGEMAKIGQSMLGARGEAVERCEIVVISESAFDELVASFPEVATNLLRQIGPRLVEAERRHEQAAFQPVKSRVSSLLLRLADQNNQVLGFTHQEMADVLGVYRETVTNAIAELKEDKLIGVGRKRISLLDPEGLRRLDAV